MACAFSRISFPEGGVAAEASVSVTVDSTDGAAVADAV
jgi:hypothetical protein